MATTIDESADRSNDALERLAASAERAERASEQVAIANMNEAAVTKRLAAEEKAAADAAARFKAKMDTGTAAVGALADSFITYNKEVYKGSSANQAAAASIEKMGEAAKNAGAFLAILVPGGPVVKALVAGLGLLTAKLLEAGAEVARHTDEVYKAYQDMAKIGATGAGGMQDVFNSLQKVGLGTQKFGEYLKLVNDNSKDLALFSGTVLQGRKMFENTMASLSVQQKEQMELMGLNDSARAEVTMAYIKQQRLLTLGTKTQMDTSSTAVMRYINETDQLTRITGLNRQEQEKALEIAMANEAFQATIIDMQERGLHESAEVAKKMHAVAYSISPEKGAQFAASLSEFGAATKLGGQAYMSSAGESAEVSRKLLAGEIRTSEQGIAATESLFKAYGKNTEMFRSQAAMSNYGESMGNFRDDVAAGAMAANGLVKNFEKAGKDLADAKTTDPLAKAQAKTAVETQQQQLLLQLKLNELMPGYIKELGDASTANRKISDDIDKNLLPEFKKLTDALKPLGTELLHIAQTVLPSMTTVIGSLTTAVKGLADFLNWFNGDQKKASVKALEGVAKDGGSAQVTGAVGGAAAGAGAGAIAGGLLGILGGPPGMLLGAKIGSVIGTGLGSWIGRNYGEEAEKNVANPLATTPGTTTPGTTTPGTTTPATAATSATVPAPGTPVQAKAVGGPVSAKTPYLVGEEGPELFVPSMAGDIVPTGQLQGTSGAALKQSAAIENLVNQIVLDTKVLQKTANVDAEGSKDHSTELKTQREKIYNAVKDIAANSMVLDSITKTDLKRAQDYSIFYKGFIDTKTKYEKEQLDVINYQMTEGSAGGSAGGGGSGTGLKMPSMPGIAGMGGGQGIQATRQDDLKKLGLNIKEGDVQAEGAGVSPKLIELARQIQSGVPGFGHFSAFNDKFHQEKASGSEHAKGLALDFTVAQQPSVEDGKAITDWLKGLGASLAIDEYNNPSSRSTAGHFHAQIPGFEEGGMLGAGKVGIAGEGGKPELISGPASITPMNDLMGALNNLNAVMERSHNTLSEIARISKATSDSSAKMLSYAQN